VHRQLRSIAGKYICILLLHEKEHLSVPAPHNAAIWSLPLREEPSFGVKQYYYYFIFGQTRAICGHAVKLY
jgi:hypothetical protein